MCKYCKDYSTEEIPYRTNSNEYFISLLALKEDGNKELVINCKSGTFGLQINYCPMCGEKLNKGD